MSNQSINAWKNPAYRASLDAAALAALPAHPAGETWASLETSQVRQIVGAAAGNEAEAQAESGGYICTYTTETCFCC